MPTQTFLNLPKEKQNKILESAKLEFSNHLYEDASINRIIKNIDIYCFINTEVNEEEKREKEFNKQLTMSEKDMNKLLENAVSEGLINNNK